jgi:hypothetical protein
MGRHVDPCQIGIPSPGTQSSSSCTLVVAPRTVAAHIEHILVKLVTPTRTLAAVRAERSGLYVPSVPGRAGGEAP